MSPMSEWQHQYIDSGGIGLHCVSQGQGPLVLLCHGFPGLWYSWRHQLPAIAAAGFRAVAMDMRGYGRSSRPLEAREYAYDRLAQDVFAVLDFFGEQQAVLVGHDFGANLAWHMGIHHPQRIRAIAPLCSPYDMDLAGGCDELPSQLYATIAGRHFFHMHYYQAVGVAERSTLDREREFLEKLFWALSADGELLNWENYPSEGTAYIDVLDAPPSAPPWPWLSAADMDVYVDEYLYAGPELAFIGGANSYRVMDHNWRLFRASAHARVPVPALFVGGAEDPVTKLSSPETFAHMRERVNDLHGLHLLEGAGHFIQQESPAALNRLLLAFLAGL
jgi:pimeloyl-ACP methyl ester carboxylesterase